MDIPSGSEPIEEVQKDWRNTMALGPVSPVYPSLYETVRLVNQLRILLGDPYINWHNVKSREDVGPYLAHRDEFYVNVVKDEVLAKHHRALLIEGWPHFARPPAGPGYVEKELRTAGATTFVIVFGTNAVGGYDDLDKRFDTWKLPALMPLKGTWAGDLPINIQRREDHWAIVDLTGKGGHVRTVPVPDWVTRTTEKYLGCKQRIRNAVNDRIGIEP